MVTGKVLLAMEFCGFLCERYDVSLPKLKNMMVALGPFLYIIDLSADMVGSLLHAIMRCRTISSTSHNEPSPLTVYAVNI